MPEGDTIYRVAARMARYVDGHRVSAFTDRHGTFDPADFFGHMLVQTEARGKHLLMHFESGQIMHSHMGMTGAWHIYPKGQPWQKPMQRCRLWFEFDDVQLVLFSPKLIEVFARERLPRHPLLGRLGPDLLSPEPDIDAACARLLAHKKLPLGVALMNQQLVAGLGNVYKSELMFIERLDPFKPVGTLSQTRIAEVLARGRTLMRRNLDGSPRRTRYTSKGPRLWVYNRHRQPCFVCGETIARTLQGDAGRSTYWCRSCQATG